MAEEAAASVDQVAEIAGGVPSWITDASFINDGNPALGIDAVAPVVDAGDAVVEPPVAGAEAVKVEGEAGAEKAPVVDPNADAAAAALAGDAVAPVVEAEGEEQVEAEPDAHAEALKVEDSTAPDQRRQKFIQRFRNPEVARLDLRDRLRQISPALAEDFETAIVMDRLADPAAFARSFFERDPDAYSKHALAIYNGDPGTFAKLLTGRDKVDLETLSKALDVYEANKDRIDELLPEADLGMSAEDWAEYKEYFPEKAAALEAKLATAQRIAAENKQLKGDLDKRTAAEKANAVDPSIARTAAIQADWNASRDVIAGHVVAWAETSPEKGGLGLAISPEEIDTPIGDLKEQKLSYFADGYSVNGKVILPSFDAGFIAWGKNRPEMKEAIAAIDFYIGKGEKANALLAAKDLIPLADVYKTERLKALLFAKIDARIKLAATQTAAKPVLEPTLPGGLPNGGGSGLKPAGASDGRFDIIQDALGRA